MQSIFRRLEGVEQRKLAATKGTLDDKLVARIEAGRRRVWKDRETRGAVPGPEEDRVFRRDVAPHVTASRLLATEIKKYKSDPLGFVLFAYPWGGPDGPLSDEEGPDENQCRFLLDLGQEVEARRFNGRDPVLPIRMAATSGHGTGKSVMGAWITAWILSTRRDSQGTVTAGTMQQLESRTWAAICGKCVEINREVFPGACPCT